MTIGTHFKYGWADPPSILPSSRPSREPRPPSRKRGIGRRYNKLGKLSKVHQACAAARLRLKGEFSTLFEAATACGACVQAMTTVLQADDPLLLLDVLAGRVPPMEAAKRSATGPSSSLHTSTRTWATKPSSARLSIRSESGARWSSHPSN
jgi:hypothetical protein